MERINDSIKAGENSAPTLTKEQIVSMLTKFRVLDMRAIKNRERLVDALVKSIIIYEDKLVFNLLYKDEPVEIPTKDELTEVIENCSDIFHKASANLFI